MKIAPILFLALPCSLMVARDVSGMYDTATLEQAAPHYRTTTNKILNDYVAKYLTSQERQKLSGVFIDFPLQAEGDMKGQPFAFYAPFDHSRVVFPIFSIKFLDDLSVAYAWLQVNGFVLDTVSEYTAMLQFKNLDGNYPPPLRALHIPADALQDQRVDELSLNIFVTARMFILLHELGHIYYQHHGGTGPQSIANEVQADQFAIDVMHRSPVAPLGALIFFLCEVSMADYPPQASTHPLSGQRLQALAAKLEDPMLRVMIADLGRRLDDPELRAASILTAKATNEQTLAPRKGHLQMPVTNDTRVPAVLAFQGKYAGQFTQQTDPDNPGQIEMVLQRTGNTVQGRYSFGLGLGRIDGTVTGDTLNLRWEWGNNYGQAILKATNNGAAFSGTWGYRESNRGAGTWTCRRVD